MSNSSLYVPRTRSLVKLEALLRRGWSLDSTCLLTAASVDHQIQKKLSSWEFFTRLNCGRYVARDLAITAGKYGSVSAFLGFCASSPAPEHMADPHPSVNILSYAHRHSISHAVISNNTSANDLQRTRVMDDTRISEDTHRIADTFKSNAYHLVFVYSFNILLANSHGDKADRLCQSNLGVRVVCALSCIIKCLFNSEVFLRPQPDWSIAPLSWRYRPVRLQNPDSEAQPTIYGRKHGRIQILVQIAMWSLAP